jgi:hypothetical protein
MTPIFFIYLICDTSSTASNTIAGPFFGNDILSNISANVFVRLLMMAVGVDWDY